jgi:hypothetical protein
MRIATLDMETDPFKYGRVPAPFACGFYDGENYFQTWGTSCVKEMLDYIRAYPFPLIIYAHNGGKFDFWYLAYAISEPVLFIDSRLVKAKLFHHEIRDSYKILPVPLSAIQKDEIDYKRMERRVREKYKEEISRYLKSDCVYLFNAIAKFVMRFGDVLTIGGAALKELSKEHKIKRISPDEDKTYRQFFHGGRCEVFEVGELKSNRGFKLYDVNSLYPFCMLSFEHPVGAADFICDYLPDAPFYLARICARSKGALPVQTKQGLTFPHGHVESFCTSHEIRMALSLGLIDITEVIEVYAWNETTTFDKFVSKWNDDKIKCEKIGDSTGRTFAKLIMNNSYGKTAQNPAKFKDYKIFESIEECEKSGFEVAGTLGDRIVGSVPSNVLPRHYKNVAVAASVTGAGRAIWMHAWACAERPVAGDTDSLWCENLPLEIDPYKLGAWKLECDKPNGKKISTLYVAGKKMYAAKDSSGNFYVERDGEKYPIKCASKGVRMRPEDIARVAKGEVLDVPIDAPSLRVGHRAKFIARQIARTAKVM